MGMRRVGGIDIAAFEYTVTAGTAIAEGDILAESGNVVQRATSSSTIHTISCVAAETITTSDTQIQCIPIVSGPIQLWEVDTANATASTQLYENMALTDHDTVNNSGSDVSGATGVFHPLALVGAASDKKLLGYFTRLPVTST